MADLYLTGVVGYDITAKQVKEFVDKTDDDNINLFISSPGGSVVEGVEIYNILRASGKKIKTINMALCASMGSILFLAGDERIAMPGSLYMVHKPSGIAFGTADDMQKEIELLDKVQNNMQAIYKDRAGIENIEEFIENETFFTVEEMKKIGVVNSDEVVSFKSTNATIVSDKESEENAEMKKIDELKAELEAEKAERSKLDEQLEEMKLEKEIAEMKLSNEKKRAEIKAEQTIDEQEEVEAEQENSNSGNQKKELEDGPIDKSNETDKPEVVAIDTKNTTKMQNNEIPAFMSFDSKY